MDDLYDRALNTLSEAAEDFDTSYEETKELATQMAEVLENINGLLLYKEHCKQINDLRERLDGLDPVEINEDTIETIYKLNKMIVSDHT